MYELCENSTRTIVTKWGQNVNEKIRFSDYVQGMRQFEIYEAELRDVYYTLNDRRLVRMEIRDEDSERGWTMRAI